MRLPLQPSALKPLFVQALLLTIWVIASQAQQPATSPSPGAATTLPTLKVTTRLVVVDVVAADGKGHPITDLKADDFTLTEEGSNQQIKVFSFQQPAASDQAQQSPAKLPPNMVTNVPTYKPNRAMSVLLLDGLNTDNVSQKYARQEMLKYLARLPAGQPVAVFLLGNRLRLIQDFTTDPQILKEAVAKLKDKSSSLIQTDPTTPAAAMAAMMDVPGMLQQLQLFQQENLAAQTDQRVQMTMNALMALARTLAGYPGRKNLIWVSSAFPANLFVDSQGIFSANAKRQEAAMSSRNSYSDATERLANELSNARVAVYPVDAQAVSNYGVYSSLSNSDSNGNYLGVTASGRSGASRLEGNSAMGSELAKTTEGLQAAHATMNTVAERTGGRAFYNTNDLNGAIREGIEDGSTYYTLGYYPQNKDWNGKFRKIIVKSNRPGVKLHYREGYVATDPRAYTKMDPKQQAMDFGQALNLEYPIATALPFKSALIMPSERTSNKLVINFGIDAHNLSFELQDDGLQHTSVDCAVQVFNSTGLPLHTVQAQDFAAALKPDQYQLVLQKFFPCNQTLALEPGSYLLRLGVRDNATGLIGTVNAPVTIAASTAAAAQPAKP
ncbi:MAG TPA: VWA domain-containing protein [Candidatus Angelobacter sp.]|nr:VWA domain-containing protein [Candidatus Angelobacter sp.]